MSLILLPLPELTMSVRNNHVSLCDARTFKHHISICRHHADSCSPFWVARETRMDEAGREWTTGNIYMVPDEFGSLVEVPLCF